MIGYLTRIGSLLEQIKHDSNNLELKGQLVSLNKELDRFFREIQKDMKLGIKMPTQDKETYNFITKVSPSLWLTLDTNTIEKAQSRLATASTFLGLSKNDIDDIIDASSE